MARTDHTHFFSELAIALTEVLGVRWAGMTEPIPTEDDLLVAICVVDAGSLTDQAECPESVSPCGAVLREGVIVQSEGIRERFPKWELGKAVNASGYVGVRLEDHLTRPIGTLWIMDDKPIEHSADYVMILRLFGRRTEAEMAIAQMVDRLDSSAGRIMGSGQAAAM